MDYNYILNSKTMTFHKPECEKASRIGTKNKIYSYAEREELHTPTLMERDIRQRNVVIHSL